MSHGAASKFLFEKGRQAGEPGAKVGTAEGSDPRRVELSTGTGSNARGALTGNFQGSSGRNFRGSDTRMFRGGGFRRPLTRHPVFELTTDDWNEISSDAMRQHMQEDDLTLKELAQEIGCNDRTAENYVQGRNAPAGINFLRCIATNPIFAAKVREVTGMAGDLDPRAMHQAMKVMREASLFLDAMGATGSAFNSSADGDAGEVSDSLTGDLFEYAGRA
jgi:hypothetical protein